MASEMNKELVHLPANEEEGWVEQYGVALEWGTVLTCTIFHSYRTDKYDDGLREVAHEDYDIVTELYPGWEADVIEIDKKLDEIFGNLNRLEDLDHMVDVFWDYITAAGWMPMVMNAYFDELNLGEFQSNLIFEYCLEKRGLDATLFMN